MVAWFKVPTLTQLNERSANTLVAHLDIEYSAITDKTLSATMPVNRNVYQNFGIMHGGVSYVLTETVGSMAGNLCVDLKDYYCVGLSINTNHIGSVNSGYVIATAHALHVGRSTHVWNIDIVSDALKLISSTRLTLSVLKRQK